MVGEFALMTWKMQPLQSELTIFGPQAENICCMAYLFCKKLDIWKQENVHFCEKVQLSRLEMFRSA